MKFFVSDILKNNSSANYFVSKARSLGVEFAKEPKTTRSQARVYANVITYKDLATIESRYKSHPSHTDDFDFLLKLVKDYFIEHKDDPQ